VTTHASYFKKLSAGISENSEAVLQRLELQATPDERAPTEVRAMTVEHHDHDERH
jgi:hypothetical protein